MVVRAIHDARADVRFLSTVCGVALRKRETLLITKG